MSLIPGLKTRQPLTLISGANVYDGFQAAYRDQTVALSGTSADPWYATFDRGNTKTAAIAVGASAATVQAALMALPRIGGRGGVRVSGTGSLVSPYVLIWQGALADTMDEEVGVLAPAGVTPTVDWVPFDWTGWTAAWEVAPVDTSDPDGYGDAVISITDTSDPTTVGQVILGYIPPTTPGGTPPSPDRTNGNCVLWVPAAAVTSAITAIGTKRANHILRSTKGGLTIAWLVGPIVSMREPV